MHAPPRVLLACVLVAGVLVACESLPRTPVTNEPVADPIALRAPDTSFRLSAEQRAGVGEGFDVDALERLLARIRPDMRQAIYLHFARVEPGARPRGWLVEFNEPELQPLLEEVWATQWDDASDEELRTRAFFYPGWEIAKERRARLRRLRDASP